MRNALCTAAKRGVDVRIVTPAIPDKPTIFRLTRSNYPPLLRAGIRIFEYTPGFIHAKSYICDDEFGVVGSVNMDFRSLYLHFECATLLYRTSGLEELKKGQSGNHCGEPGNYVKGLQTGNYRRPFRFRPPCICPAVLILAGRY